MTNEEICAFYNREINNKINLKMNFLSSTEKIRVFEVVSGVFNECILKLDLILNDYNTYDFLMKMGPSEEIKVMWYFDEFNSVRCGEDSFRNGYYTDYTELKLKEWLLNTTLFSELFLKINNTDWQKIYDNLCPGHKLFKEFVNKPAETLIIHKEFFPENVEKLKQNLRNFNFSNISWADYKKLFGDK